MSKIVKWIGIIFVVGLIIAVANGYRGGAKNATGNYHRVQTGAK